MPDDQGTGVSTTQPTDGQPNDAGASTPATPETPPAPKPDSANALIKNFAKERGVTVEELIDQFKTYEDAGKSEKERLESDLNRWKSEAEMSTKELRELRGRVALQDAVSALTNVYDPATVVDLAVPLLEYGKDGRPSNIQDALNTLKERRPRLFPAAAGSGDGGKGGTPTNTMTINDALRSIAPSNNL